MKKHILLTTIALIAFALQTQAIEVKKIPFEINQNGGAKRTALNQLSLFEAKPLYHLLLSKGVIFLLLVSVKHRNHFGYIFIMA